MVLHAAILAGGVGTRLWPCSQRKHPKQFLDLLGQLSLLQATQARLLPLVCRDHTLVVTGSEYADIVREQLPMLPPENLLFEPAARGTAAAIGLAAIHLRQRDPDAVMAVLPADHVVVDTSKFRQLLSAAEQLAKRGWLVTLGVPPTSPETGFGYIERGDTTPLVEGTDTESFCVARFVEKPDRETAEVLLSSGKYDWNSGMFVWTVECILQELATHLPELYAGLAKIEQSLGTHMEIDTLRNVWRRLPNETIDYGVLEKSCRVAVVPADIGWSDVGSWDAVYDHLPHDAEGNAVVGQHLSFETANSLIIGSNRLVVTLGLEEMVIVENEDIIFVCPRSRSQDVKQLAGLLESHGLSEYL